MQIGVCTQWNKMQKRGGGVIHKYRVGMRDACTVFGEHVWLSVLSTHL
jgi:hypothetical protein